MKGNTFPEAVYYYFKEWQEFEMAPHRHTAIEIMYVINGTCKIEIDGRIVDLRQQQYIFIYGNVPHRLIIEKNKPCRMLNIEFEWKDAAAHFTDMDTLISYDHRLMDMLTAEEDFFVLKDSSHVYNQLRSLVLELDLHADDNKLPIDILFIQLLTTIAKSRNEQKQQIDETNEWMIHQVLAYIHENYDTEIKVQDLADIVHLHPSYLHRVFKQALGVTINDYMNNLRIEKAKMLLTKTDIPVTEIASYVGINTSQYFSNMFKAATRLTPSQYRKKEQDFKGIDKRS
ncbi:AraC family transcriptional regulator [Gracilibacillus alcaliphilus]|uniref:AraC family transcriptional regulator n=1 Tax=Gracilibacillus alcaliphilus TaxID=1401441 RepID=UPI00195F1AA5|nr:AraC family transcriptional regulator [Gracilibacillus alcaliphilus]MBM7679501.1 AraC-like DNA-binding protein [Gracilibacillus alcaliphilus]